MSPKASSGHKPRPCPAPVSEIPESVLKSLGVRWYPPKSVRMKSVVHLGPAPTELWTLWMRFGWLAPLTLANARKSERHHFQVQIKILNVNFSDAYRAWNLMNTVDRHPCEQQGTKTNVLMWIWSHLVDEFWFGHEILAQQNPDSVYLCSLNRKSEIVAIFGRIWTP